MLVTSALESRTAPRGALPPTDSSTQPRLKGRQRRKALRNNVMQPAGLPRLMALLVAVAVANLGCAHTQAPERKMYLIAENASRINFKEDARAIGGSGAEAYCNELQIQCYNKCWARTPPFSSVKKHSAVHREFCTKKCREEFNECVDKLEKIEEQDSLSKKLAFPSIGTALDWLKENTPEAPPGTTVVVAGVVFVVVIIGGALFLAPV